MPAKHLPPENSLRGEWVNKYELIEEIGSGERGVVYKALEHGTGDVAACKLIPSENIKAGKWLVEIGKVQKLAGVNTVAQYKSRATEEFNGIPYICILYEYIGDEKGAALNLRQYIKKNPLNISLPFIELIIKKIWKHSIP